EILMEYKIPGSSANVNAVKLSEDKSLRILNGTMVHLNEYELSVMCAENNKQTIRNHAGFFARRSILQSPNITALIELENGYAYQFVSIFKWIRHMRLDHFLKNL